MGDVEKEIKSQWLQEEINSLGEKKTGKRFSHSAVDKIQHIGKGALYLIKKIVPQEWQKYVSLDVTNFIPVFNRIGDKRVVLVFDDLERAVSFDPVEIVQYDFITSQVNDVYVRSIEEQGLGDYLVEYITK